MIIDISIIWCPNPLLKYNFQFNDVSGVVTFVGTSPSDEGPFIEGCSSTGDIIGESNGKIVIFDGVSEYGFGEAHSENISGCSLVIDSVTSSPSIGGADGKIIIAAHADEAIEYAVETGGAYAWQDSPIFNRPAGSYYVMARQKVTTTCITSSYLYFVTVGSRPPINGNVTLSKTNVTAIGAHDGTLLLTISGGSGNFTITPSWEEFPIVTTDGTIPVTVSRAGLYPDVYSFTVYDDVTDAEVILTVEIAEPSILPPVDSGLVGNFLFAPNLNPLNFVQQETIDNCEVFQTPDNTLFCSQKFPGYKFANYFNPIAKCDSLTFQIQANYNPALIKMEIKDYYSDSVVKIYFPVLKETNIGVQEDFEVTLQSDPVSGKTRLYFNVGAIPIPLELGDGFGIQDNADGFDGVYAVLSISYDELAEQEYITLNKNWVISAPTSSATGLFSTTTVDFNVLEFLVNDLASLLDGDYFVEITATSEVKTIVLTSEPFKLAAEHEDTNCIDYSNDDNDFDMTWTTGIVCRIRVPSTLFKRIPGGIREVSRNSDETLRKLMAKKHRVFLMEFWHIPPYLVEKLSCVFDCSLIKINGIEYQTEEGISEPKYKDWGYRLANCDINVEQVEWFKKGNSDNLGNVDLDGGGLLLANGGTVTVNDGLLLR